MKPSLIIILCNLCMPVCPLVFGQLTLEHHTMSSYPDFSPFSSQSSLRLSQSTFVSTSPLNISGTGDGMIDEVRLDLGEVVIAPYRPRISMRKPLILGSQSAIVLGLGDDIPQLQIENIGPDGSHGMKFRYGMDLPASITFNAIYDVYLGKKTTVFSDNVQSLMKSQTFDKATPKLLEKISSGNTGVNSFFDITYDLQALTEIRRVTDLSEDVTKITSYDKSTPKLSERISSGNMGVNSFFDIEYDIQALTATSKGGDLVESVIFTRTYDKATPKLIEAISSGNTGANNFFEVIYDIGILSERRKGGGPDSNIIVTRTYDKVTPKLEEKISTENMGMNNFFLASYDLPTLTATSKGGTLTENVTFTRTYDKATPKLLEKISTGNTSVNRFFDITYDMGELKEIRRGGTVDSSITVTRTYNKAAPKLEEKVSSGNAGATSFFDIAWDLSQSSRPRYEMVFTGVGMSPMRKQTDVEILARIISERYVADGGLSHTIEHRMIPDPATGTSMVVLLTAGLESSFLRVNGGGAPFSVINTGNVLSNGNMEINGMLTVNGPKNFKIDHPLDPANKYLIHSCVESPDMMNIYNGNVTTDINGHAQVVLPEYFEALNTDFRYQLTCIGQFAQVIVAEKITDNAFSIRTDKPFVEVSWQVTGVRQDPAALKYKQPVEVLKRG